MRTHVLRTLVLLLAPVLVTGQGPQPPSAVTLYNDLQELNFLGSALYIAAHPDDENTRLISYLSNAVHARTAYLSMTRGDGGQNLIGTELRELLGVLRTQELLAARRVDGGEQFFTRAVDFGYSKHPDETLEIWDKDKVLSDVVRIIRQYRPDVIINRFDHRTPGSTHGHHTSSAMLSTEAFDLAANPAAFPDAMGQLEPWQPQRLFHNTTWWFYGSPEAFYEAVDRSTLVTLDVGVYYPERGVSNNEIASLASSQHRCQGFGRPLSRGSEEEFLELIKGTMPQGNDLFEGINTRWSRIPGGAAIGAILEPLEAHFNFANPASHLPELLQAYALLESLEDDFWKPRKLEALRELIAGVCGLYLEASSEANSAVPGSTAGVQLELLNRSSARVTVLGIELDHGQAADSTFVLVPNKRSQLSLDIAVPPNHPGTSPYWLREAGTLGSYHIPSQTLIGKPETPPAFTTRFTLEIEGKRLEYTRPVIHRYSEPDKGERYRAFEILPALTAAFDQQVVLFADAHPKQVQLRVKSHGEKAMGRVGLQAPPGWVVTPQWQPLELEGKGDEKIFQFSLMPPQTASEGSLRPLVEAGGQTYQDELIEIAYDHIPTQSVLMPAQTRVVRLQVQKEGQHIGYVMGAGDALPEALEAIGYTVHPLTTSDLTEASLKGMDAVVMGIRAYNVLDDLPFKNPVLLDYVQKGGTLVVQYNTTGRGDRDFSALAPYPLQLSRDRVSDETAKVTLLNPDHPVLQYPNPIGADDFEGWVQERGLYFPNQWDPAYTPLLSMQDPGEPAREGSLLVAPYGEGHYIYTGLSFFREMPAGVSGAFKLFANMLSVGKANLKSDAIKG